MKNTNFLAKHLFMEPLADCVGFRLAPFTTTKALIDSELRDKERIKDIELKKDLSACNLWFTEKIDIKLKEMKERRDIGIKREVA